MNLIRPLRLLCVSLVISHLSLVLLRAAELDLTSANVADLQSAMSKGTLSFEKLTQTYLAASPPTTKLGP